MEEELLINSVPMQLTPDIMAQITAIFGMFFGIIFILCMLQYVLSAIAMWNIFKKAGEPGWKAIIPIYNSVILFRIAGKSFGKLLLLILLPILSVLAIVYFAPNTLVVLLLLLACFAFSVWAIVYNIKTQYGLSKNFGYDVGFTFGLVLVNIVFMMILAFDDSRYIGQKLK